MNIKTSLNALFLFSNLLCAQATTYTHSTDYTEQIFYLNADVALLKTVTVTEFNYVKFQYSLVQSKFLNEPELASSTGHQILKILIGNIQEISFRDEYVILKASDFDSNTLKNEAMYYLYNSNDRSLASFASIEGVIKETGATTTSTHLNSILPAFDRLVVEYLLKTKK
jgi:hypothetical protein